MATYYNTNDLLVRRVKIAQWLTDKIENISNHSFYGELMCCEELMEIQYVSACLEAIECYTPITDDDDDGVDNCLTEEQLDNIFNNIVDITGLCFPDKNQTYNSNIWSESISSLTDNNGDNVNDTDDASIQTGG